MRTLRDLAIRGVRYYWRAQLGLMAGVTLAAMVIGGATIIGTSVDESLKRWALSRVGQADVLLFTGDRFMREKLAEELSGSGEGSAGAILMVSNLSAPDSGMRWNGAQVLGVEDDFWALAEDGKIRELDADDAWVSEAVARRLKLEVGDPLVLRLENPSLLSKDAPLSGGAEDIQAMRLRVAGIVGDSGFCRFGLQASQLPPGNVFVRRELLQQKLDLSGRINLVLLQGVSSEEAMQRFRSAWQLLDANLKLWKIPGTTTWEVRSERVFLEDEVVQAVRQVKPESEGVLTYFVNELRKGEKATPYSMVTATSDKLAKGEMVISQWLAEDTGAELGDSLRVKYFVMGERRRLSEEQAEFKIVEIRDVKGTPEDRAWMPDFPGLADSENCRDWDPGVPVDLERIRDKDEEYWDSHRGAPKAFISLEDGQELWGNRFGKLTALRFEGGDYEEVASSIMQQLRPEELGLQFVEFRDVALAASESPIPLGVLFLSFGFFLVVAALLLTGLLFVFSLEQRREEAAILLSLGYASSRVRSLFWWEGFLQAGLGALAGTLLSMGYAWVMLTGLATVWQDAVGAVSFDLHLNPVPLVLAGFGTWVFAGIVLWSVNRRWSVEDAGRMLASHGEVENPRRGGYLGSLSGGVVALLLVGVLMIGSESDGSMAAAGRFFGMGALALVGGLAMVHGLLVALASAGFSMRSGRDLALRSLGRRRWRSLVAIGVLASGIFMVVSVGAFRQGAPSDALNRKSGTGGFTLLGLGAIPIYEDLGTMEGRKALGIPEEWFGRDTVVAFRMSDGDDASCLNLNQAPEPRLLGVKPHELGDREAFRFVSVPEGSKGWDALDMKVGGMIPGIVDDATLKYAMGRQVGDVLEYAGSNGQTFQVKVVGTVGDSLLQGTVVISEAFFQEVYPDQAGYRMFLVDSDLDGLEQRIEELSRAFRNRGLEWMAAHERLSLFQGVQNAYISIFQVLGGLGVLLGSAGLGIVVMRNVLERRGELAVLEAGCYFSRRRVRQIVLTEHLYLVMLALVVGFGAALVSVWPQIFQTGKDVPWGELILLGVGVLLNGGLWVLFALNTAMGRHMARALAEE